MRPLCARPLLLALALTASACTSASGSFGDVVYGPVTSAFAVADRHDLVVSRGTVVATRRPDADQKLTLFFTGASVQPNDDWRRLGYTRFNDVRRDLAENDALLIDGIPLIDVAPGAEFSVEWAGSGRSTGGAFDVAMAFRPTLVSTEGTTPIGEIGTAVLTISDADPRAGGFVNGSVILRREAADDQDEATAAGEVTISFQVSVVAERRGKANLGVARPIVVCAAERGPTRSAGCRDEEAEVELQASGLASEE